MAAAVAADLRDLAAVLADPGLRAVIDSAKPMRLIRGAVLHSSTPMPPVR